MTTLYLIRHGTTDANALGIFQGALDLPLNALGLRQAACLGQRFESIHLDALYSTPLIRTVQTAQGLRGDKKLMIIPEKGLAEVNGGRMEGRSIAENEGDYPGIMDVFRYDVPNFSAPGGESTRDVYDRVVPAMDRILKAHAGESIACISHGFAIQTYLCYARGIAFEDMPQCILSNTAVCRIVYTGGDLPTIDFIGDDSHLPDELKFKQPKAFRA